MLSTKYLETFITTAECGSFRKAGDALYITPSAVIKQIDLLEEEAGVPLFERTHRGLVLTESGESLYNDAKTVEVMLQKAVERARKLARGTDDILYIGTSPITPAEFITEKWEAMYQKLPGMKVQIVPFQNTEKEISHVFRHLGEEIDLISGTIDEKHLAWRNCSGVVTEYCKAEIAVPMSHPWAKKKHIQAEELLHQEILLLEPGKMEVMDRIREDLLQKDPAIRITDFPYYAMEVFNQCEQSGAALVTMEKWTRAHPTLKTIEVTDWQYQIPYGLLYAKHPSAKVRKFLELL